MGKKDNGAAVDAASTVVGTTVGLDARLSAVYNTLTEEERKDFDALSLEDRIAELSAIAAIEESSAALTNSVEMKEAKEEKINLTILTAGGPGLRPGTKLTGYFMGVVHIFAKDFKENWKEFKGKNQMFYENSYFKLKSRDGVEFGIWNSATLSILTKTFTHSSLPAKIAKDPLVTIEYVGKIVGRETLERDHGIKLTAGNSAHVFKVLAEKDAVIAQYVPGVVCSLNAPFPIESDDSVKLTKSEATRMNYEKLMGLQGPSNQMSQLLSHDSVQ